jgi:hypothetical protein
MYENGPEAFLVVSCTGTMTGFEYIITGFILRCITLVLTFLGVCPLDINDFITDLAVLCLCSSVTTYPFLTRSALEKDAAQE